MESIEFLEELNLKVVQDTELYCFTSDSILLSKFAKAKNGEVVADFCSGSGVVGFNFYGLNSDKINSVTFFELQKPLYDLSVKSIKLNQLENKFFAVNTRLQDIGNEYVGRFSLVLCNPPYMSVDGGAHDKDTLKAICRREVELNLKELILSISKALKFGGRVCLVHRADRLSDIFCTMREHMIEPKRLQLVQSGDKEPYLVMIEGVKGGKSGVRVMNNAKN